VGQGARQLWRPCPTPPSSQPLPPACPGTGPQAAALPARLRACTSALTPAPWSWWHYQAALPGPARLTLVPTGAAPPPKRASARRPTRHTAHPHTLNRGTPQPQQCRPAFPARCAPARCLPEARRAARARACVQAHVPELAAPVRRDRRDAGADDDLAARERRARVAHAAAVGHVVRLAGRAGHAVPRLAAAEVDGFGCARVRGAPSAQGQRTHSTDRMPPADVALVEMRCDERTRVIRGGVLRGGAHVVCAAGRVHVGLVAAVDGVHVAPGPHRQAACARAPRLHSHA